MAFEHLTDRLYSAAEVSGMLGRNKSRIHQLTRQFDLGQSVAVTPQFRIKYYSVNDILWLARWFEENGRPHTEKGRTVDAQFKPEPKFGRVQ